MQIPETGLATSRRGRYLINSGIKLVVAMLIGVFVHAKQYGPAAFLFCLFLDTVMPPKE